MRRHGPHRVMGKLIAMQIDRDLAKDIVRELFGEEDEDALLDTALEIDGCAATPTAERSHASGRRSSPISFARASPLPRHPPPSGTN